MVKLSFEHAKLVRDSLYTHQEQFRTFAVLASHFPLSRDPPTARDEAYFRELLTMLSRENVWIYDTYHELCALERRFCSLTGLKCDDPFVALDGREPVIFLISGLKVFFAYHILDLCAVVLDKATSRYLRLDESSVTTEIQDYLTQGKCEQVGEPRDVSLSALEPFSVVASRCLAVLPSLGVAPKDAESLLAVLFSVPFHPVKSQDWDPAISFVSTLLDKYMQQDDPNVKSPSDLLGVKMYRLFKGHAYVQTDRLRRVGELCIGHYMKLVENWDLDFLKLKESIDREEYSRANLEVCDIAIKELSTMHDAFRFSELPSIEYQMQAAWETLVKYRWARKMLKDLEDPK